MESYEWVNPCDGNIYSSGNNDVVLRIASYSDIEEQIKRFLGTIAELRKWQDKSIKAK